MRYILGNHAAGAGRLDEAAEHYERARALRREALGDEYVAALMNLGIVRDMQGRPAEAGELLRRAVALSPLYAEAHYNLANYLERHGDAAGAAEEFAVARRLTNPSGPIRK